MSFIQFLKKPLRQNQTPDVSNMVHQFQKFFRMVDGAQRPSHLIAAENFLNLMAKNWGLVQKTQGVETGKDTMLVAAHQHLDKRREQIMVDHVFDDSKLINQG